ncbi:APM1 Aminopeptidase, partial [Acromyrmex heyeri]
MDFIKALCLVTLTIIIYDLKNEMYDLKNKKNEIRSAVEQIDRLPTYIVPTNYNIKLIPYFENYTLYTLEGETSIRIRIYQKTQYIYLHQYFLVIFDTPTLINEDNGNSYKLLWEQHIMYNSTTHILTFYLAEDLSPGFYILNMKFYGMPVHPKENILNSFINGTDVIWLNTGHFQPIRGRRLFPCWDEPAFKTTFKISILHHENYTALSNTPIQKLEFADNNMVWTHFRTTPLMSTYHVAVVLTNFLSDSINANAFEHQAIWCTTDSAQYTKFAENIFEIVTSHLGTRWNKKIAKLDHVVLPESENMWDWHFRDGMSLWGLIFYRERKIIYNEAIDPPSRKIEITRLVVHEIAHYLSNNLIRLSWWSYLWITDGIAGLLAANAINEIFPDSRISDLFVVQMQHDSLNLDTHSLMKPLQQKINDIADIDLLFTSVSYIKGKYPVVNVIQDSRNDHVIISHKGNSWWIPITYTTQTDLHFNDTKPYYWLTPYTEKIIIPNIKQFDWIILNLQQTGYYRVNYDLTMWQRIISYLNSDNYKNIHILNRAQILDDAFYFAIEEKSLNLSTFWNLSHYLSRETDYVAWYPMIKIEIFKIQIAKWACVLGDSDCRIIATSRLEWHFTNPEKHKYIYCLVYTSVLIMHNTSKKTMDRMEQQIEFMHETILKITKSLERTNNKMIIFRYIAYFKLWNLLYFMVKNLRRTSSYFSMFLFVTYYFLRECILLRITFIILSYFMKNEKNEFHSAVEQINRLPTYTVPTNYNIKLIPYFKKNSTAYTLRGETSTRIHIHKKTRNICFHQYFLFIFNISTLINEDNGIYLFLWPQYTHYNPVTHILTFYLTQDLLPGFYILNIKFYGMSILPKENDLKISYINRTPDVMWLNAVYFQPIRGRRLFPCWDEPAFKATFNISILHHENYTALSNMPIQKLEFTDNNMVWTHFRTTPLMSTYHVAVVLTNFHSHRINANTSEHQAIWCRIYSAQYTKFAENIFEIVTSHLGIRWNKKIAKLDHVVLPESENMWNWYLRDGMSQWGLIFYRETRVLYNEAIDPPSRKIEIMRLVTHEVVHHWLNNLVRLSWWSYLWIIDGIAGLLAANAINEVAFLFTCIFGIGELI